MSYDITVPYVPTPKAVIREMLKLADLKPGELVFDLGCGDGRVIIMAAKEFNAYGVGIEMRSELIQRAMSNIIEFGVQDRVLIIQGNFCDINLSPADVVFLYLLTSINEKLRPKLERELKEGARVVSHDFQVTGWTPKVKKNIKDGGRVHWVYLYEI